MHRRRRLLVSFDDVTTAELEMANILFIALVSLAVVVPAAGVASFQYYRRTVAPPPSTRWLSAFLLPLLLFFFGALPGVRSVVPFLVAGAAAIVVAIAWIAYRIRVARGRGA